MCIRDRYKILSERHIINIYEVFISLVVFVKDVEFEDKVLMIFKAFDVSGDGCLDRKELSKFLMCAILGLCKLTGLPEPSRVGIKQFTYAQFKIVDDDGSGQIEFPEFESWLTDSIEIQDFMLRFTGCQTMKHATMRFNAEQKRWGDFFDEISVNFCGKRYVEIPKLISAMDAKL